MRKIDEGTYSILARAHVLSKELACQSAAYVCGLLFMYTHVYIQIHTYIHRCRYTKETYVYDTHVYGPMYMTREMYLQERCFYMKRDLQNAVCSLCTCFYVGVWSALNVTTRMYVHTCVPICI